MKRQIPASKRCAFLTGIVTSLLVLLPLHNLFAQEKKSDTDEEERLASIAITLPENYLLPDKDRRAVKHYAKLVDEQNDHTRDILSYLPILDPPKAFYKYQRYVLARLEDGYKEADLPVKLSSILFGKALSDSLIIEVIPVRERAGPDPEQLHKIAGKYDMHLVLAIPTLELYKKDGVRYAKANILLYDSESKEIVFDAILQTVPNRIAENEICKDNDYGCRLSALALLIYQSLVPIIVEQSPELKKIADLHDSRTAALITEYELGRSDETIVKVLKERIDSIGTGEHVVGHTLLNRDKDKFIAFVMADGSKEYDTGLVLYDSYTVTGMQHENKWYIDHHERFQVPVEDAETRSQATFLMWAEGMETYLFEKNTAWFSDSLWSEGPFKQLPDISKDILIPASVEEKKAVFVYKNLTGEYRLVVSEIIKQRERAFDLLRNGMKETLVPELMKQAAATMENKPSHIYTDKVYPIFSPSGEYVLIPMLAEYGNKKRQTFYLVYQIEQERLYLWEGNHLDTAFTEDPRKFKKFTISQLESLSTESAPSVDSDAYWSENITLQDGSGYMYLREVKE
ncbi:hypothetical protein AB9P05_14955 [Roseivirga sp. BDSF3-8]|uniref:hypothetical protein n=1 Tax=Roseivirga sp. BDSF3-8 TaxID=3241598 RepID=UPI00353202F5